jgi:hypothetical protein
VEFWLISSVAQWLKGRPTASANMVTPALAADVGEAAAIAKWSGREASQGRESSESGSRR